MSIKMIIFTALLAAGIALGIYRLNITLKRWSYPKAQRKILLSVPFIAEGLILAGVGIWQHFNFSYIYSGLLAYLPAVICVMICCQIQKLPVLKVLDAYSCIFLYTQILLALMDSFPGISVRFWCLLIGYILINILRSRYFTHSGDSFYLYMAINGYTGMLTSLGRNIPLLVGILNGLYLIIGVFGLLGIYRKIFIQSKPVLLFDLDGTLIDSQPLVFETFKQVFKKYKPDYTLSQEELYSFFGPTLEVTFAKYFPKEQIDEIIDEYQKINKDLHPSMLKRMPHAKELLENLNNKGYKIGIVSNKRTPVVQYGLELSELAPYCDLVLGKEDLPQPKPKADGLMKACQLMHTELDNVVYIGDNASDIAAAKNMAAYSIGYTNDPKQKEALIQSMPCAVVEDLLEIETLLKEDRTWNDNSIW